MDRASVRDFRAKFVEAGNSLEITRSGKVVAMLVLPICIQGLPAPETMPAEILVKITEEQASELIRMGVNSLLIRGKV
jgi:antitoxin (DNA-binding transcriptional repressor) of toxin-antitoxin stability system